MKKIFAILLSAAILMTSAVTFAAEDNSDNYRGEYGCYGDGYGCGGYGHGCRGGWR